MFLSATRLPTICLSSSLLSISQVIPHFKANWLLYLALVGTEMSQVGSQSRT